MKLGEKIPRNIQLTNPHLSPEQRQFDSAFALYSIDTDWQLESKELGAHASRDEGAGEFLHHLVGAKVQSVTEHALDSISIKFASASLEFLLQLQAPHGEQEYALVLPDRILTVAADSMSDEPRGQI